MTASEINTENKTPGTSRALIHAKNVKRASLVHLRYQYSWLALKHAIAL